MNLYNFRFFFGGDFMTFLALNDDEAKTILEDRDIEDGLDGDLFTTEVRAVE